jgi:hypothetical protein
MSADGNKIWFMFVLIAEATTGIMFEGITVEGE